MPKETPKPILLLAEDADDDAFFFRRMFEKTGKLFDFHHVFDGGAAIEFLQKGLKSKELPRVIFLDLKMPVQNGFDVLNWMRKQKFPAPVPVYILSGSEQQQDKDLAYALGAIDYLVKPIDRNDLSRILDIVSSTPRGSAKHKPGDKP